MTDIPTHEPPASSGDAEHAWVHDNLAAYLAEGLEPAERQRFDAHINACPDCFDAFTEARDADRHLQRTLSAFAAENSATFEDRITTHVREKTMTHARRLFIRRTSYAAAACLALAATGVFANYAIHQNGRFNNPLSRELVAQADTADPTFESPIDRVTTLFTRHSYASASADSREIANRNGGEQYALNRKGIEQDSIHGGMEARDSGDKIGLVEAKDAVMATGVPTPSITESRRNVTLQDQKSRQVEQLTADAHRLYDVNQLKEADDLLHQATTIDPQNENTKLFTRLVEDKVNDRSYEHIVNRSDAGTIRQNIDSAEHLTPYANGMASAGRVTISDSVALGVIAGEKQKSANEVGFEFGANQVSLSGSGSMTSPQADKSEAARATISDGDNAKSENMRSKDFSGGAIDAFDDQKLSALKLAPTAMNSSSADAPSATASPTDSRYLVTGKTGKAAGSANEIASRQSLASASGGTAGNYDVILVPTENTNEGADGVTSTGGAFIREADEPTNRPVPGFEASNLEKKSEANSSTTAIRNLDLARQHAAVFDSRGGGDVVAEKNTKPADVGAMDPNHPVVGGNAPANKFALNQIDIREVTNDKSGTYSFSAGVSTNSGLVGTTADQKSRIKDTGGNVESDEDAILARPSNTALTLGTTPKATVPIAAQPAPPTEATTRPSAQSAPPAPSPGADIAAQRKIIRSGNIDYEVRSFDDTYVLVKKDVEEVGGFVSSNSSEKLANGKVRGSIVVRVPPENLDALLVRLRSLGDQKGQQIGAADVTKQFTDTESELRGLRTMEGRLLDLIKNGKGEVKDLIAAEAKLGDTRIQIEKLEGELRYYNNQVSMATLTINAIEKDFQTPTAAYEMENINLSVETEEVEAKYQKARSVLSDAKARIVESQLKNTDADHIAAVITADVPPDQADFVAAQLKQLGKIASFTRDRHQTTAGGEGAPEPRVQVEQKDTRFSISLYNLANLAPRETTVLTVAVRDVESAYKNILSVVRKDAPAGNAEAGAGAAGAAAAAVRPMGRIINTNLNGQVPEQMSADIRAELRTDAEAGAGGADAILQAIRDSGEVIASSLAVNPDTTNSTAAKRGLQLRLVNIAAVPPKETVTLNIAVRDVDASYKKALAALVKPLDVPAPAAGGARSEPQPTGRILFNAINGQQPEQMNADIRAEVRADQADAVLQALRDSGEIISSGSAQNPDPINVTHSKEGVQIHFVNVIAVPARETQRLRLVASDVADSYKKLLDSLQAIAAAGNGHVFSSSLNQADPRTVTASLAFEASTKSLTAVDKAFADAGIDMLSRIINRASNTNTLDTKVAFVIDELKSAESLDPNRTFTLNVEVENVDRAMASLRGAAEALRSTVSPAAVKEVDFSTAKENNGRTTGHIVLDVLRANSASLLASVRDLNGIERDNQVSKNAQVPETRFAKDRIELTLISRAAIVQSDQGLWLTVRAALSSASGALIYSLYLVLTGLMFIAPFALIIWPLWKLMKRRKTAV